ncbi:hypothetical protein JHD49_09450 [Sulfurimonas sp. SAG-AH-194-C21]|nr:hypothetical protein [Sulfurimonas sp. SAG-AH-194-C21]MDF1884164.1 hypothetical protein [Sulfurimonas sp. SAG-AH-194-C21]
MGQIEALQKRIDQVADKVRHLRYIIIALMSGIIGTVFGISQNKINDDIIVNTLLIGGTIGFIAVGILVNIEEKKRNKLINKLENTKKDEI